MRLPQSHSRRTIAVLGSVAAIGGGATAIAATTHTAGDAASASTSSTSTSAASTTPSGPPGRASLSLSAAEQKVLAEAQAALTTKAQAIAEPLLASGVQSGAITSAQESAFLASLARTTTPGTGTSKTRPPAASMGSTGITGSTGSRSTTSTSSAARALFAKIDKEIAAELPAIADPILATALSDGSITSAERTTLLAILERFPAGGMGGPQGGLGAPGGMPPACRVDDGLEHVGLSAKRGGRPGNGRDAHADATGGVDTTSRPVGGRVGRTPRPRPLRQAPTEAHLVDAGAPTFLPAPAAIRRPAVDAIEALRAAVSVDDPERHTLEALLRQPRPCLLEERAPDAQAPTLRIDVERRELSILPVPGVGGRAGGREAADRLRFECDEGGRPLRIGLAEAVPRRPVPVLKAVEVLVAQESAVAEPARRGHGPPPRQRHRPDGRHA